ncbi:MAG: hypothetical protein ABIB98_00220 [bacterium]
MPKILISPNEKKCIGCGLCVIKASLISDNNVSLKKSFIRVYGKPKSYFLSIDYGRKTDYKEIVNICPQNCFEIKEQ